MAKKQFVDKLIAKKQFVDKSELFVRTMINVGFHIEHEDGK